MGGGLWLFWIIHFKILIMKKVHFIKEMTCDYTATMICGFDSIRYVLIYGTTNIKQVTCERCKKILKKEFPKEQE
jgi:hypothetical protein